MVRIRKALSLVLAGCVVLIASGCSKTAANESNFRDAINRVLSKRPLCAGSYSLTQFPLTTGDDKFLDVMASKELITKTPLDHNQIRYDLTDAGRATVMHSAKQVIFAANDSVFCYGIRKVDKVLNYTEPASSLGQTMVTVSYTWKLTKPLPSWAADPAILVGNAAFDQMLESFQKEKANPDERKANAVLVLTHKGWRSGDDADD